LVRKPAGRLGKYFLDGFESAETRVDQCTHRHFLRVCPAQTIGKLLYRCRCALASRRHEMKRTASDAVVAPATGPAGVRHREKRACRIPRHGSPRLNVLSAPSKLGG